MLTMAGNKVNTKTKGKEDKNKTNSKTVGQNSEDGEEPDFALLRKPISTSVTGFAQARKIFDLATEELKDLLTNECDLLYECKVCRNLFRSLANFISHKRVYCKEKFNTSKHGHFVKNTSIVSEIMKIKHLEQSYQESLKESRDATNSVASDDDERIPLTRDLTTVIEQIAKSRGAIETNGHETQVSLQKIPNSSVAVFQNVEPNHDVPMDDMKVQVKELDGILSKDTAVLQSDGNFKIRSSASAESDNVIQISDDEENENTLKCKICDMQFSTQKTLKFHMKYKHVESRLVFPCPDCLEIFSTSWSVYRHLFKVHRKTAAQIRRLRESIQAKAFKMNNPPAFYERRKNNNIKASTAQKITEEERIDQENQAWMDNLEGDGELPRCGGCGRTFERRAALAAHTHTCQPRSRALARRPQETKKIEIQIRKDYNKGPPVNLGLPLKTTENIESKPIKDETPIANKSSKEEPKELTEEEKDNEETSMDVSEDDKSSDAAESPENECRPQVDAPSLTVRLPFAHQAEKSNHVTFKQKVLPEIDLDKLSCKRCEMQFNNIQTIFDHMAEHLKWMRYACKLCNFKSYSFENLPEHVKVVHKLKGNKDFYFSTVKALDGPEALELCELLEETPDASAPALTIRLPFAHQAEKSNHTTFKQKVLADIELDKLSCKRCDLQLKDIQTLYDHMAEHMKWMRYACKLCNFKSYSFENLPEHVKVVHKLKGNKDFYFSTIKALDGPEALELCEPLEEIPDASETSPDSGRPSRCSSDSSRLSDDSSSSSTRIEGSRKRKMFLNKSLAKRRKESVLKGGEDCKDGDISLDKNTSAAESFTSSSMKSFEENSSDLDDVIESVSKRPAIDDSSVASRRPVRRKAKPKNADFEYDLSNLLKMEAQGYRDSVSQANSKSSQSKKKVHQDMQINYENLNKESCGALMAMSKKSVVRAAAHMRTSSTSFYSLKEIRPQNIFLRPMLPRSASKGEKASPKKDINEDKKECSSPHKENTINKVLVNVPVKSNDQPSKDVVNNDVPKIDTPPDNNESTKNTDVPKQTSAEVIDDVNPKDQAIAKPVIEMKKPISIAPLKFRRPSLDVIKNPIINKNISDFTKAGMKTKILVIKPINRNKDGTQAVKTPLKFQTIKLKDPNKNSSSEDKASDQVVVVKVPKVECTIARPAVPEVPNNEKPAPMDVSTTPLSVLNEKEIPKSVVETNCVKTVPLLTESSVDLKESDSVESNEQVQEESNKVVNGDNKCEEVITSALDTTEPDITNA